MAIYVTHGAKKNVGDYLIHARGRALLAHLLPDAEIKSVARWQRGELPEDAKALVMCGGPGVSTRMVEDTFPIVRAAVENGLTLAGIGLGWSGLPARAPQEFSMSAGSLEVLRGINANGAPLTVRDDVTHGILTRMGIETVRSGCTAWYSVPHLGTPVPAFGAPKTVVFTTPARPQNTLEAIKLMGLLKKRYAGARLVASFHRGVLPDRQTDPARSAALVAQAVAARALGFEVLDAAYDLSKIDFYGEADLHVGYRVHAHLAFVSQHRPSVLLTEDGRGYGQSVTLNGEDSAIWNGEEGIVDRVDDLLSSEERTNWPSLHQAVDVIESSLPLMKEAVSSIGARAR
ncbi:polysaccharide pyruvyl transferase family protein [Microbacterium sp. NPDC096154]|uniref:polysaccharide pyruvyl transferase family protein n=1 Tax=Microbacterium sp. NPDC096154 TaxID=3155549 RepID=UPI003332D7C2